jgi:glycine C-acetyltransferase
MPLARVLADLEAQLAALDKAGVAKGRETVVTGVVPAGGALGPRVLLDGERTCLRMNSNSYLGLSLHHRVIDAAERATRRFGAGPGAVRFISGTTEPHVRLESALADFHARDAVQLTSSAYTSVMGVLATLVTPETAIFSDELNHSCIVNGMKLARPLERKIYPHLDLAALERDLSASTAQGALIITDGVFSMRGDHAPLDKLSLLAERYDARFPRGVLLVVDDSHGVGAFGASGRGTEEVCGARADLLIGTLGKAFGVNGGYVASSASVIRYLREKNPFYIYSNPISPSEAAAALEAVEIARGDEGVRLLAHLRQVTHRFRDGLARLGFETIPGQHPVVPLLVRDTARTRALSAFLREHGVLATGLAYPVVPRGSELIRFQLSASHTAADVDEVLSVLARFKA